MRFRTMPTLLASLIIVGLMLPATASGLTSAGHKTGKAKACGKKKSKQRKKGRANRRPCKKGSGEDTPQYVPRAYLFWRGDADVDLHVFDALGNHSSPANTHGIPGTVQTADGLGPTGIDGGGPRDMFLEPRPLTARTFYFYACLDYPSPQPVAVGSAIADNENSVRWIPEFVLTNDGDQAAVGRTPASAPDPGFPIPALCQ